MTNVKTLYSVTNADDPGSVTASAVCSNSSSSSHLHLFMAFMSTVLFHGWKDWVFWTHSAILEMTQSKKTLQVWCTDFRRSDSWLFVHLDKLNHWSRLLAPSLGSALATPSGATAPTSTTAPSCPGTNHVNSWLMILKCPTLSSPPHRGRSPSPGGRSLHPPGQRLHMESL